MNTIFTRLRDRALTEEMQRCFAALESPFELPSGELIEELRGAVRWLHESGEIDVARELLLAFAEKFQDGSPQPTPVVATILRLLGVTHRLSGELQKASDCLARAKVYYEILEDPRGVAMSLNGLGAVYASLSYWSIAEACFLQAQEIAEANGFSSLFLKAQRNLVFAYAHQGRFGELRALLRASTEVDAAKAGEAAEAGMSTSYVISRALAVGGLMRQFGSVRRARTLLEAALTAAERGHLRHTAGVAHHLLGECALDRGDHGAALAHFKKELAIGFETSPLGDLTCRAYLGLAEAHLMLGDTAACERAVNEGWQRCQRTFNDETCVGLLRVKAHAARACGDDEAARRHFGEALTISVRRSFRVEEAITLEEIGFSLVEDGDEAAGTRRLEEAAHLHHAMGLGRLARRLERGLRARTRPIAWKRHAGRRRAPSAARGLWQSLGLVTRSRALLAELEKARDLAATPLAVLVRGETGVGKEPIARAIHALSGRPGRFVDVAPAIPETMLESDLFGCEKGAFTGAETRPGLVASAAEGTLFFDEVGDLPLSLQVKLLRFLETLTFRRVGGSSMQSVNLRLVSATNAQLEAKVQKGAFREDLYHRLAAGIITVPALRDRPEDIEPLTVHFLADLAAQSDRRYEVDDDVLEAFASYRWSGNVRELRNVIATMFWTARARNRTRLGLDLVPPHVLRAASARPSDEGAIRGAFAAAAGNVAQAARSLGLSRQQLYRRLAELGLDAGQLRSEH